jgi:hypothetical protein
MPRKTAPADRAAVEDALSPVQRQALQEFLTDLRCSPEAWQAIEPLRSLLEAVAVARLVTRAEIMGATSAAAYRDAAARLDVDGENAAKRWRRWRRSARTSMSAMLRQLARILDVDEDGTGD